MAALTMKQQRVVDAMQPMLKNAPWILRITERKQFTGPVFEICERRFRENGTTRLFEYGRIYNDALRTCKDAIRRMVSQVEDDIGRPLGVQELINEKIAYRGHIPLDETAGAKLALLFKLHPVVRSQERIELMAWRIERFSREESLYWLSKISIQTYGRRSVEWAKSGLRLMLAGQQKDRAEVERLLELLRN